MRRRAERRVAALPIFVSSQALSGSAIDSIISSAPSITVVPGTEIMPGPAPEAPIPPSQGMEFVLEQLQAKDAYQQAISKSPTLPSTSPKLPELPDFPAMTEGLDSSAAADGAKKLAEDAAAAASAVSTSVVEAANSVTSVVGGNVGQAASVLSSTASQMGDQLGGVLSTAEETVQQLMGEAAAGVSGAQSTVVQTVTSVSESIQGQMQDVLDVLPAPAREVLGQAAAATADALHFVASQPAVGGAVAVGTVAIPAIILWNANFAGFAGRLLPQKALQLLQTEDALLVDIRSGRHREDNGVPELKRGARGKGVAISAIPLLPSVARRVRSADGLALQILGAQVASLSRVDNNTFVIILDERGDSAKAVARAATGAGVRQVYTIDEGFRGWKKAGLPIVETSADYGASPIDAIGDAAEVVVEEAATLFRRPSSAALAMGTGSLVVFALVNYHLLMRYIGVLGLEATLALRVMQYNSPQDALDDIAGLVNTIRNAAKIPLQLTKKVAALLPAQQVQSPPEQQRLQGQERLPEA